MSMETVATGLHFPTSLAFDPDGGLWVAESGLPFGDAPPGGRLLRVGRGVVAEGLGAPTNGITWHDGAWIVSEGGRPGRITRITPEGDRTIVLDGLPGHGNYQTNMAVVRDGWIWFGQGAMTNMGVVGPDSLELGWLGELDHAVDRPGYPISVTDASFRAVVKGEERWTGAFAPFGVPGSARDIPAALPCTSAVMRCRLDGSGLECVAWGLRNPYGLVFLEDGRLLATDQGADERGSRPIARVPELLFEVRAGAWYGFPDFVGGVPVTDPAFSPEGPPLSFVLTNHAALPPPERPLVSLPPSTAATKMATIPGRPDEILVTLFGEHALAPRRSRPPPNGDRVRRRA